MNDDIASRISEALDRQMMSAFYGSTVTANVEAPAPEPLTLDKLRRMMLTLPPRETWLSSRIFPSDSAYTIEASGERFTAAHPVFWLRFHHALRDHPAVKPEPWSGNPLGFNIEPIEIDPDPEDTAERAEWKKALWCRLSEAFKVAMVPLPTWLRSPPKFGKHG